MNTTNITRCLFSQDIGGNWWLVWIGDDFVERSKFIGKKLNTIGVKDTNDYKISLLDMGRDIR